MTLMQSMKDIIQNKSNDKQFNLVAVKAANDEVMSCIKMMLDAEIGKAILIDDESTLKPLITSYGFTDDQVEIVNIADDSLAAEEAVALVRAGRANGILKGHISTGKLLKAVVNKEKGIVKSPLLSHVAALHVPKLNKIIGITDGGMILTPNKDEMNVIIDHAVEVFHKLGVSTPKVALLSAAETLIPKLSSSVIQDEIAKQNNRTNCIIEGPLSADLSLSPENAKDKHYPGQIQGDADIIVVPDIVTGNSLSKSMLMFGGAQMAGLIIGAQVPIILTSRSSSAAEKFASILLAQIVDA
ncbi:phosphate acetyl/butyryl transferase [Macrococcoides goetzii]|uniref:Phosphate acetyl/butyryl transferase n=1 Tax=Macrococcoides goetzii TaxID=1891097 RepID=A0A2G5NS72_9STAP|nr:phosphate acyltransferase [Macrococcus goetzii]RAI82882.1 phosphate acetyl/butyryl transferase [Macrococcus goetzii]